MSNTSPEPRTQRFSAAIAATALLAVAAALWLPALDTPFWGDDYVFLQDAHAANQAGDPWWSAFWPRTPYKFWRPLSQESWWRLVDAWLGADAYAAHVANLALLAIAAGCVGLFGVTLAQACDWQRARGIGVLGGAVYGALALHLLPVHWAAAANNSILVIFTALVLAAWVAAPRARGLSRALLLVAVALLLTAALLSKESAASIPLLMAIISLFVGSRIARIEIALWLVCLGLVALWLILRTSFTADTDAEYDLVFGTNLVRNGLALIAWLLNVPREALRLVMTGEVGLGLLWVGVTAMPMAWAWVIAVRQGRFCLRPRQWLLTPAFAVVAYLPYFPLAWNSYAYYAAIAAMLPTIVLARCLTGQGRALTAAALIGVSSWFAVAGSRALDHPGLIGRARWAEAWFQGLAADSIASPLLVRADDPQRFYAMGTAGLAWRLNLNPAAVHLVDQCPEDCQRCLVIPADGRLYWQRHGAAVP